MRLSVLLLLGLFSVAGCSEAPSLRPSSPPTAVAPPPSGPTAVGTYLVTLTASTACAAELPTVARERSYTATFFSDGHIDWGASTLQPPLGHAAISSGAVAAAGLSFSIDVERDPQSDDFHGLWDVLGNGTFLNISGRASGVGDGTRFTGTLKGVFAFYEPHLPPNPSVLIDGRYCSASDHRFTFVKQ